MPGHLFIVPGDLKRLACDVRFVPCDASATPEGYQLLDNDLSSYAPVTPAWKQGIDRVLTCTDEFASPQQMLVNVGGHDKTSIDWYVEGVRQFLDKASLHLAARRPSIRPKALVGLPVVGIGKGGAKERAGDIVTAMLPVLYDAVDRHDFDIALVAFEDATLPTAQSARDQYHQYHQKDPWPELGPAARRQAKKLAAEASAGNLALFMGAGVSFGAGLPSWSKLLDELASDADIADPSGAMNQFDFMDRATIIEGRLKTKGLEMRQRIAKRSSPARHSLQHSLLAGLPVREVVTTNYDELFETAWQSVGRTPSILPHKPLPNADCWILKMHGSVSEPDNIILTRQDYVRYLERWSALAGIVQTLLMTRHMLFVGYSLTDHDFHQISEAVRRVVSPISNAESAGATFGTMLDVSAADKHALLSELWAKDIECIRFDGDSQPSSGRQLEIFLDYMLSRTCTATHLLNDAYESLLTDDEQKLRNALLQFIKDLSPPARRAPAWKIVARALAELGHIYDRPGE